MTSLLVTHRQETTTSKTRVCFRRSKRGRYHPDTAWSWNRKIKPIGKRFMRDNTAPLQIARRRSDLFSWKPRLILIIHNCNPLTHSGVPTTERRQSPANYWIIALPSTSGPQKTAKGITTSLVDSSSPRLARRRLKICSRLRTWETPSRSQKSWSRLLA